MSGIERMNAELAKQITGSCPVLYRGKGFSFECHDGWYELISSLSIKIEVILERLIEKGDLKPEDTPYAAQVKEKFGSLRFYTTHNIDDMGELIETAEALSEQTCETCGEPGKILNQTGWLSCCCLEHKKIT